jgi:hypothetical protein
MTSSGLTLQPPMAPMGSTDRDLGIPAIRRGPWGTHFCQFYRTKQDLVETLVPYFRAGLDNNEFCMWITSEPLEAMDAATAMRASVPGFGNALRNRQIEIVPYTDWYSMGAQMDLDWMLAAWISKLRHARSRGFEGVRVSGNSYWLQPRQWNDFAEYEAAINRTIGKLPMIALCTYPLEKCGPAQIEDVMRNHQFALTKHGDQWQAHAAAVT